MILRVSKLFGRVLVLLVAVIALALGLFAWFLMTGPVSVAWLTPYIERELSSATAVVHIEDTQLRLGEHQSLNLSAIGVHVRDPEGRLLSELPEVEIGLSTSALLFEGRIALRWIEAVAPTLLLTRREDGSIGFAQGSASDAAHAERLDIGAVLVRFLTMSESAEASKYLEHVRFSGGELILEDQMLGRTLIAREAELNITGFGDRVTAELGFSVDQAPRPAIVHLSASREPDQDWINIEMAFEHLFPADFADFAPDLPLAGIRLPLSGNLQSAVSLRGDFAPILFDVAAEDGVVEMPQLRIDQLAIEALWAHGTLAADLEGVAIDQLRFASDGAQLSGQGEVAWRGGEPTLRADLEAENVTMAQVERFWPRGGGEEARTWVVEHISGGVVPSARAQLRFGPGELGQKPLPEHALAGEFAFRDLTVRYVDTMPPVQGVSGSATFTGQRMDFTVASGHVGDLALEQGSVVITGIGIKGRDTTQLEIATHVAGPVRQALSLIDHPPLGFASRAGIAPAAASGQVVADLRIGMPLHKELEPEEEARVAVDATITDGALTEGLLELTDAQLQLTIDRRTAELKGEAVFDGAPVAVEVRETFQKGAGHDRSYHVEGSPDTALLSKFGVQLPFALRGEVGVAVTVTDAAAARTAEIALDLTPTAIDVPQLNWRKEAGELGRLTAALTIPTDGPIDVTRFTLASRELHAEGTVVAQVEPFRLERLRLDELRLGATQARLAVHPGEPAGYDVRLEAQTIDLAPWWGAGGLAREQETSDAELQEPMRLRLQAERVMIDGGSLRDVGGELVRDRDGWRSADLKGRVPGGGDFALTLAPDGAHQHLRVTSTDAGHLLQALRQTGRIEGGQLEVDATVLRQWPSLEAEGAVVARKFDVLDAPLLARLLTLASLTGIGNLLGGEGLAFEQLDTRFVLRDQRLQLEKGRVYGSQLGLTFHGQFDLAADTMDMEGTIAPLYGVNWAIGRIPIIGQLLRGSEGEGAFAATYSIRGPLDEPTIRVNPLSALAPGFLRELFSGLWEGTLQPPEMLPSRDD